MLTIAVVVLVYLAGVACWICLCRSAAAADEIWEQGPGDLDRDDPFGTDDQHTHGRLNTMASSQCW